MLSTLLAIATALFFIGCQYLYARHGAIAALATGVEIPPSNRITLAVVSCAVGVIYVIMAARAWLAFERWLAIARMRSVALTVKVTF